MVKVNQNQITKQQNNNVGPTQKDIQPNSKNVKTGIKLTRFKYKVKDQDGKIIESYFDAENRMDVQSFLLNKGLEILTI